MRLCGSSGGKKGGGRKLRNEDGMLGAYPNANEEHQASRRPSCGEAKEQDPFPPLQPESWKRRLMRKLEVESVQRAQPQRGSRSPPPLLATALGVTWESKCWIWSFWKHFRAQKCWVQRCNFYIWHTSKARKGQRLTGMQEFGVWVGVCNNIEIGKEHGTG